MPGDGIIDDHEPDLGDIVSADTIRVERHALILQIWLPRKKVFKPVKFYIIEMGHRLAIGG